MDAPKHSRRKMHNSSAVRSYRHVIEIDSDSDEENFALPKPKNKAKPASKETFKTPKPLLPKHKDTKPLSSVTPRMSDHVTMMSFLKSLSPTVPDYKKDLEAGRYVRQFSKLREELTQKLFVLYNNTVFDNKLPKDLPIKWNARLLKTAGYCRYKRHRNSSATVWQSVEIELSTKVCDSAERVRDTLIHELCHAAVWIINGTRDGHGPYWKYWARKSNFVHPELPVINRCHNYSITTKYTYKCVQCGYEIGRHSKSLDTVKKVCGLCRGRFELLVSGKSSTSSSKEASGGTPYTPRAPSKFALFVKENYKTIKQSNSDFKHSDVMKALSKQFAEKNRIKDD
ncbi:germ cell nuclear acidic protein-like [Liolophura sinensis]|uniref:germ cell nuclear acidic protein-like n=1 Tax=Liolophura sinensis TaxID=3198878 RepID=UPI0031598550